MDLSGTAGKAGVCRLLQPVQLASACTEFASTQACLDVWLHTECVAQQTVVTSLLLAYVPALSCQSTLDKLPGTIHEIDEIIYGA